MNGCYYNEKTADGMFEELGYTEADIYKTADEMFKELGYHKRIENDSTIMYEQHDIQLEFYVKKQWVEKSTYFSDINVYGCKYITMQELQAINKKVQELGWKG